MAALRIEQLAEGVTLMLGDCLDLLPGLAKGCAVVTDPPYGIGYCHGARKGGRLMGTDGLSIVGDDKPFDPSPWLAFPECLFWGAEHFKNRLPDGGRWLVWNKRRPGVVRDQGCVENAWCSSDGVTRLFDHPWDGADLGPERGQPRVHSNQKPIDVMRWSISFVEQPIIIDPFMGSGTTGVAAVKLGRRFIGIEIDETHFTTAVRRISDALNQPDLFVEPPKRAEQASLLDYDSENDIRKSVNVALATVKERKAQGGPSWPPE